MELGTIFTLIWAGLAVAFLVVELYAFYVGKKFREDGEDPGRGTFSWHIWWLRERWWGRLLALVVWGWAFYHFFFEPNGHTGKWWDDLAIILSLGALSFFIRPRNPSDV